MNRFIDFLINFIRSCFKKVEPRAIYTKTEKAYQVKDDVVYFRDFSINIDVKDSYKNALNDALIRIYKGKVKYSIVGYAISIPWEIIAVIHFRESHCNFERQLLNGQKWNKRTTITPKNHGPWTSWEQSCLGFLESRISDKNKSYSEWLAWLERYNGMGYRNKGRFSPYIFAGTRIYTKGLFVSDGKFDPEKVDKRVGCYILLKKLGFFSEN